MLQTSFQCEEHQGVRILRLQSGDGTNRLTHTCVVALTEALQGLRREARAMVIAGNSRFFSVGANLEELVRLTARQLTNSQDWDKV